MPLCRTSSLPTFAFGERYAREREWAARLGVDDPECRANVGEDKITLLRRHGG